jgi:pimeloyl-ACP methyl ester carboxylesterase
MSKSETVQGTVRYKTEVIEKQTVFYREAGDRRNTAIVLLHGFPASSYQFRDLIPLLAKDYYVIAPDFVGFGHSSAPSTAEFAYTFDHLTEIVSELLVRLGIRKYALYLHDYGGPVGFRIAAQAPDAVVALIVQNANAYMEGVGQPVAEVFLPLWQQQNPKTIEAARVFLKPETVQYMYTHGASSAEQVSPDTWTLDSARLARAGSEQIHLALFIDYQSNVALYDQWQHYFRTSRPRMLILWGRNDPLFVAAGAVAFKKDLPKAELHWLEAGHFALEEAASEAAAYIKKFLGGS